MACDSKMMDRSLIACLEKDVLDGCTFMTSDPQLVMSAFLLVDRCHEKDRKWKRKSILTVGKIWLVDFLVTTMPIFPPVITS